MSADEKPGLDPAAIAAAVVAAMKSQASEVIQEAASIVADDPKAPKPSPLKRLSPRMLVCLLLAVALAAVVALISPQQVPVAAYKLALVTMGGYLGYWLDRWVFPYARPDGYLCRNWQGEQPGKADEADHGVVPGYEQVFSAAMLRRGIIMLAVILAVGMAL